MNQLLQTLVSTVVQGSVLALITIGMTLVYGTLRVLNMAQGVMVMVGGFAAYTFLDRAGLPVWASLIAAGLVTFLLGCSRLRARGPPPARPLRYRLRDDRLHLHVRHRDRGTEHRPAHVWAKTETIRPIVDGTWNLTSQVSITYHSILIAVVAIGSLLVARAVPVAVPLRARHHCRGPEPGCGPADGHSGPSGVRRDDGHRRRTGRPRGRPASPSLLRVPNSGDLPLLQALIVAIFAGLGSGEGDDLRRLHHRFHPVRRLDLLEQRVRVAGLVSS